MTSFHSIFGIVVAALFLAVAALGYQRWRLGETSELFWRGLRTAQVLYLGYLAIAAVKFFTGDKPHDGLYWVYALLPVVVSFFAEQLRIGSARMVLDQRGLADATAVGQLPDADQREVVITILRREMGVMALAAVVIAGLLLRASLGFDGY
jgi:hypothetical protein